MQALSGFSLIDSQPPIVGKVAVAFLESSRIGRQVVIRQKKRRPAVKRGRREKAF
jgi:hypothetical protein